MKHIRVWIVLGSLSLGLSGACGKATSGEMLGGETHWYRHCGGELDAATCGPELECVCGICTRSCSNDASCTGSSSDSQCSLRDATDYASLCDVRAAERICVPSIPTPEPQDFPVEGRRYDPEGNCFAGEEIAGVTTLSPTSCFSAQAYARAPDGNCWTFRAGCWPDGFVQITDGGEPCTQTQDVCAGSLSCEFGEVETIDGCLNCADAVSVLNDSIVELVDNAGWNFCTSDIDCAATRWEGGCDGQCPVAVNAGSIEAFRAQAPAVSARYCSNSDSWRTFCSQSLQDCGVSPICRAGRCVNGS